MEILLQVNKILSLTRPLRLLLLMAQRHSPLLGPAKHLFHLYIALTHLLHLTILRCRSPTLLYSLRCARIWQLLTPWPLLLRTLASLSHYLLEGLLQLRVWQTLQKPLFNHLFLDFELLGHTVIAILASSWSWCQHLLSARRYT